MDYRIVVGLVGGALLLSACGQTNLEKRAELLDKKAQETVEETIDVTPKWFTNIPQKPEAVYSVGTAISGDLQFSVDKAILNGKVALADRINGKLSASQKSFIAETTRTASNKGIGILRENERAAKNVIAEQAVTGYNVHKSIIRREGTYYRTFVMLEFPLGDANDELTSLVKRQNEIDARIRAKKAFKQLDRDVTRIRDGEIKREQIIQEELNAP